MKINKEVKIGVVVLGTLVILFWGLNFLKGRSLFISDLHYFAYFDKVDGLKVGSPVQYRGYKIGVVAKISYKPSVQDKIRVNILVSEQMRFSEDSRLSIFSQDLMGTKAVKIITGTSKKLIEEGGEFSGSIEGDLKEQVSMQIAPLKKKAERMLSSLDSVLVAIQYIFNEETKYNVRHSLKSISRTLNNLERTSGGLDILVKSESKRLNNIFSNIESISDNLKANNENISNVLKNVSSISDTVKMQGLSESLASLRRSMYYFESITHKINDNKGTLGALVNNRDLYNNLNETMSSLNGLINSIEKNPKKYVRFSLIDFGSKNKSLEYYVIVLKENSKKTGTGSVEKNKIKMEEMFYKGKYIYFYRRFEKFKNAEKNLTKIKIDYPNAYILKIKD